MAPKTTPAIPAAPTWESDGETFTVKLRNRKTLKLPLDIPVRAFRKLRGITDPNQDDFDAFFMLIDMLDETGGTQYVQVVDSLGVRELAAFVTPYFEAVGAAMGGDELEGK